MKAPVALTEKEKAQVAQDRAIILKNLKDGRGRIENIYAWYCRGYTTEPRFRIGRIQREAFRQVLAEYGVAV